MVHKSVSIVFREYNESVILLTWLYPFALIAFYADELFTPAVPGDHMCPGKFLEKI
jgi:hypothetical protein